MLHLSPTNFHLPDSRVILFRGVNLSGSSKYPVNQSTHTKPLPASFVDRPFALDQADIHLQRLKKWGINLVRYVVCWEAIEPHKPGEYDSGFIQHTIECIRKCHQHGIRVIIDPHQDTWSRFSGGSGAPAWTLELAGFNLANLHATGAATLQHEHHDVKQYPKMIWATNTVKLAAATMWTLFFAGEDFAPKCTLDDYEGVHIQDFLQTHFLNAFEHLFAQLQTAELLDSCVIGYDTLNEPSGGYLNNPDLSKVNTTTWELNIGATPNGIQSFRLGNGMQQKVEAWAMTWRGPLKQGYTIIDPQGKKAWADGRQCIWAQHGVWDAETGKKFDWKEEYQLPFLEKQRSKWRAIFSNAIIFVEPQVNNPPPKLESWNDDKRIAYAPHWYDGITLVNKKFSSKMAVDYIGHVMGKYTFGLLGAISYGWEGVRKNFDQQIKHTMEICTKTTGLRPVCIGEFGIPFDMDNKSSYSSPYSFKNQSVALDTNLSAMEHNLVNYCLWNYSPDCSHEWGDGNGWNDEDLSIFCADDGNQDSLYLGARCSDVFIRPHATLIAGTPLKVSYTGLKPVPWVLEYECTNLEWTVVYVPEWGAWSDRSRVKVDVICSVRSEFEWHEHELRVRVHIPDGEKRSVTLRVYGDGVK